MEETRGRRVKAIPSAPPRRATERGWRGIPATTIMPPRHSSSSSKAKAVLVDSDRTRVKYVLKEFHEILKSKLQEERRGNPGNDLPKMRRVNLHMKIAADLKRKWVNAGKRVGHVSGVQTGDKFRFRAELCIIGLHGQFDKGIDYLKDRMGREIATSVVASDRYRNNMGSSEDSIIYSGEGGNPYRSGRKVPKDQKLERGNLALKNSMEDHKPVRVIFNRGTGDPEGGGYVYHGLYFVEKCWKEKGDFGNIIFKFQLNKIPEYIKRGTETKKI